MVFFMSEKTELLILVQTEPNISEKYGETVCTAGITRDLNWIRLYPIQRRINTTIAKYRKYDWIECETRLNENNTDTRKESRKVNAESIKKLESMSGDWSVRRRFLLQKGIQVFQKMDDILEGAKTNSISLCLFKPKKVIRFYTKETGDEFTKKEQNIIDNLKNQGYLFSLDEIGISDVQFKKVPYSFICQFTDIDGKCSNLTILDWEITTNFRKGVKNNGKNGAKELTLQRYNKFIKDKDIYFILGTRNKMHNMKKNSTKDNNINPWSIISIIPFPKCDQMELDLGLL